METTSISPLVTVLTPVYNGAEFLRECIESVLAQDYQAWEYIIVNNLLASGTPLFPNDHPHSDTSACYEHLHDMDFGVVHEVLAAERVHEGQITSRIATLAAGDVAYVEGVLECGPRYLDAEEYAVCRDAA
jgi:cellulose synthase/poly-beta-1,6-N-acetylglucosamine synthase-like glycosyltransferase